MTAIGEVKGTEDEKVRQSKVTRLYRSREQRSPTPPETNNEIVSKTSDCLPKKSKPIKKLKSSSLNHVKTITGNRNNEANRKKLIKKPKHEVDILKPMITSSNVSKSIVRSAPTVKTALAKKILAKAKKVPPTGKVTLVALVVLFY